MSNLLVAKNLSKQYSQTKGFFSRKKTVINALDDVSLNITKGITLAVVGESGSGKSTLAKALIRLVSLDKGHVTFNGVDFLSVSPSQLKGMRKDMQMIFQDPYASLNPRMKFQVIMLRVHLFVKNILKQL